MRKEVNDMREKNHEHTLGPAVCGFDNGTIDLSTQFRLCMDADCAYREEA
jgi:hypothetical protein